MADPPATPAEPARPPSSTPPLAPKPAALVVVLALVGVLVYNLYLDAQPGDYDGKYVTFAIVGLMAGVLGVDLSRFWRGRGDL